MNSTANSSTLKPTGDVKRLSVSGARVRILAEVAPVREVEKLAVRETLGRALAERPYTGTVAHGDCAQIMTGAPMPAGTDTVVPREQVRVHGDNIAIEH